MEIPYIHDLADLESVPSEALVLIPDNLIEQMLLDMLQQYISDYRFDYREFEDFLNDKLE
jgi:hypothetical protein